MSAAFTPAPWSVRTTPRATQGPWREMVAGELVIGEIYGDGEEDHEPDDAAAEANANLIAASPDLYQMTEWLERIFKYEIAKAERDNPEDDEGVRLRQLNLSLVQDALAKARGEAA